MKKKHWIIFLIVLLVVVNISTDCGYNRFDRAHANPIVVNDDEVDSIRIKKPEDKKWRKLDQGQEYSFEQACKALNPGFPNRFTASYEMRVFLKSENRRTFYVKETHLREGRLYYYTNAGEDFFDRLYAEAK
jgi:hypothetical protein